MPKRKIEEKNELVEEFFRRNDPKNIKSMDDMYTAWKNFFGPAFQKMIKIANFKGLSVNSLKPY